MKNRKTLKIAISVIVLLLLLVGGVAAARIMQQQPEVEGMQTDDGLPEILPEPAEPLNIENPGTARDLEAIEAQIAEQGIMPLASGDPNVAVAEGQNTSYEDLSWFDEAPEELQEELRDLGASEPTEDTPEGAPGLSGPLDRAVQAVAGPRPGGDEIALLGGDGGVYRLYLSEDGWDTEPFGLETSLVSELGYLPDGNLYAADFYYFYTGTQDGQWTEARGEFGGVYDVVVSGGDVYLATSNGAWKGDGYSFQLISDDVFTWSATAAVDGSIYFGGEVFEEITPEAAKAGEEEVSIATLWRYDGNWTKVAEWEDMERIRDLETHPEYGVVVQGQWGMRFQSQDWGAWPTDTAVSQPLATFVDTAGVWVGGDGFDELQLLSNSGDWTTYPVQGLHDDSTVVVIERVGNYMFLGTSFGVVIIEVDMEVAETSYPAPPTKEQMRVRYGPPKPLPTYKGSIFNWKWCRKQNGVPVEIVVHPQSGPDFEEGIQQVRLWHWYNTSFSMYVNFKDSVKHKITETCNMKYYHQYEADGYVTRKGVGTTPSRFKNGRKCWAYTYMTAQDFGDQYVIDNSDFIDHPEAYYTQMRGTREYGWWVKSGPNVNLENNARWNDTHDDGLQVWSNAHGWWRAPEQITWQAGLTYAVRVHVGDATWNSAYIRVFADWDGKGNGTTRIDSFGDRRFPTGWHIFRFTVPNNANALSFLRSSVTHEPVPASHGGNAFHYQYNGVNWRRATGEVEDYAIIVRRSSDVGITKTDLTDPVLVGNTFTYRLTARNYGPATATNVRIIDTLPAGLVATAINPSSGLNCNYSHATRRLACTRASMPVNATASVDVTVRVPLSFAGNSVSNTAVITNNETDTNTSNDRDTETTTIQRVDLSVTKTDSVDPVIAGNIMQYTINVRNHGTATARNVRVTDTLPSGLEHISTSAPAGWSCGISGSTVTCTRASVGAGYNGNITLVVRVPADANAGRMRNTVRVTNDIPETSTTNNDDDEDTDVIQRADLSILKTDLPDPAMPTGDLRYTLAVDNAGPSDARNVRVSDVLPAGLNFVNVTGPAGWNCGYSGVSRTVSCTIPMLRVSAPPATIVLDTTVQADFPGSFITNTGRVTSDIPDPVPNNDSDDEGTTIQEVSVVGAPTGWTFAHVRLSDQYGIEVDKEGDYLSNEYIYNHMQIPIGMGFAFHADSIPNLCLSNTVPCPAVESVPGIVMVQSYSLSSIAPQDEPDNHLPFTVDGGATERTLNRYAVPTPTDCTLGDCVGYEMYTIPNFEWTHPDELLHLNWLTVGGEVPGCPSGYVCVNLQGDDVGPGNYIISGLVNIEVSYPGYPDLTRTYALDAEAVVSLVVPQIQPTGTDILDGEDNK